MLGVPAPVAARMAAFTMWDDQVPYFRELLSFLTRD
jgi:hypothetical protein